MAIAIAHVVICMTISVSMLYNVLPFGVVAISRVVICRAICVDASTRLYNVDVVND